jgi:hypothetical protein
MGGQLRLWNRRRCRAHRGPVSVRIIEHRERRLPRTPGPDRTPWRLGPQLGVVIEDVGPLDPIARESTATPSPHRRALRSQSCRSRSSHQPLSNFTGQGLSWLSVIAARCGPPDLRDVVTSSSRFGTVATGSGGDGSSGREFSAPTSRVRLCRR